jgi:branched-chain amino acid transport system ATP-binding protein
VHILDLGNGREGRRQMKLMLEVKNLSVSYENALALNNINLEVYEGEIVGLFSPNGAGKTTLMNSISGLIADIREKEARKGGVEINLRGEINYKGENIIDTKPSYRVRRGIGLTREGHPVFPDSDVIENLKIAAFLCPRRKVGERIERVFETFPSLKGKEHRRAGFLSGGEQQMLFVGMALMTNPQLLLMDEPLLGLSPSLQDDLVETIQQIRRGGVTIFITEQFARPLFPMIDHGYIIENGMVVISGTGKELMTNPEAKAAYFGV